MARLINKNNIKNLKEKPSVRIKVGVSLKINVPIETSAPPSIQIDTAPQNFSFKNLDLDNELIINPNILQSQKMVKNKNLTANNKFEEIDDPFYDLDEQKDSYLTVEHQKIDKKLSKVTKKIKSHNKIGARHGW